MRNRDLHTFRFERAYHATSALSILFLSATAAFSQAQISFPDTMPQRGVLPNGAYTFDKLESINKTNGNVTYSIPLTSMPLGRGGLTIPISLVFNSSQYDYTYTYTYSTDPTNTPILNQALTISPFSGWTLNVGYSLYSEVKPLSSGNGCTSGTGNTRTSLIMPDGSRHVLQFYNAYAYNFTGTGDGYYPWSFNGATSCTNFPSMTGDSVTLFTSDGSYIKVVASSLSWTAYFPNGMTVYSPCPGGSCPYPYSAAGQIISDRNGNKITIQNFFDLSSDEPYTLVTDDVGRTIKIATLSPYGYEVTQTGFGAPLQWNFGQAPGSQWTGFSFQYTCVPQYATTCTMNDGGGGTDMLTVPSNDPSQPLVYTFHYYLNSGLLQTVTLPSGASTTYSWGSSDYTAFFNSFLFNPVTGKSVTWYDESDGAQPPQVPRIENWSYQYLGTDLGQAFQQTAPDGGNELTYLTGLTSSYPAMTVKPSGETIEYDYLANRPYGIALPVGAAISDGTNPYVAAEIHSVAASGNLTYSSITTHTIDKNGNDLNESVYDYVPSGSVSRDGNGVAIVPNTAALLRSTDKIYNVTTAQAGTGAEAISDDANAYWNPASQPIPMHELSRLSTSGAGVGGISEYSYDGNGNPIQERLWDSSMAPSPPSGLNSSNATVTSYGWDSHGNLTSVTDPRGTVTAYSYDTNDLYLASKTQNSNGNLGTRGLTWTYTFNFETGLMTSRTDSNGVQTLFGYDAMGRPTSVQEAAGTQDAGGRSLERDTNTTYEDANRRVIVTVDQNTTGDKALTKITDYDQMGRVRLTRQLETPGSASVYADDTVGIKVQTRYMYSSTAGKSYQLVSNPYREATSTAAGSACPGNFAQCTMGWTLITKDQDGRTISKEGFDGSGLPAPWGSNNNSTGIATTAYSSQTTTYTDEANHVHTAAMDGLDRLVSVTEYPVAGSQSQSYNTSYTYDAQSDLTGVSQGAETRTFVYDSLKRLTSAANPESGTIQYSYDGNGNLVQKLDARGSVTGYSYDALNRIIAKSYWLEAYPPDYSYTPTVNYTYDAGGSAAYAIGRVTQVSNDNSTTTYASYDPLGHVTSSAQTMAGETFPFQYSYNVSGSLISETYPSGRVLATGYDGVNRPDAVSALMPGQTQPRAYVSNATYSPHGELTQIPFGNLDAANPATSVTLNYGYNDRLRPYAITTQTTSSYLQALTYAWNANGTLGSVLEGYGAAADASSLNLLTQCYWYDGVDRLSGGAEFSGSGSCPSSFQSQGSAWSRNFGYDQYGNMWVSGATGMGLNGQTPTSHVYTLSNQISNQISGVSYDWAGNQAAVGGNSITYDGENRQTSIQQTQPTPATEAYLYDGNGRRVEKIAPDGSAVLYVYDAKGALAAEYSSNALTAAPCATCYLMADHLGSTRLVTDPSANVIAWHDYLPFGEEILAGVGGRTGSWGAGSDNINQKFTGKERDQESGLDWFNTRYFGSALGRFMSPDPLGILKQKLVDPQQWNAYAYARNNPLRFIDPTGAYLVNCAQGDKKCNQAADDFEKQRQKDLKSKNKKVREAAKAWGDRGQDNHVNVTFKTQTQVDADAATQPGYKTDAIVSASADANHEPSVQAEFSEDLKGSSLGRTIAHEGSHIEDDMQFLNSYDSGTGKYNPGLNFTHFDTEFQAFEAGSGVKAYPMFPRGPRGYQQLEDYIYRAYPNADDLVFPPSAYPQ